MTLDSSLSGRADLAGVDRSPPVPVPELGDALVSAIARRRRRMRLRVVATGLGVVAAASVLGFGGILAERPSPALAIETEGEWIEIRVLDSDAGAAQMTEELSDLGLDARVTALPADPLSVGKWLGFRLERTDGRGMGPHEDARVAQDLLRLGGPYPNGFPAAPEPHYVLAIRRSAIDRVAGIRWEFLIGRELRPGEEPSGYLTPEPTG